MGRCNSARFSLLIETLPLRIVAWVQSNIGNFSSGSLRACCRSNARRAMCAGDITLWAGLSRSQHAVIRQLNWTASSLDNAPPIIGHSEQQGPLAMHVWHVHRCNTGNKLDSEAHPLWNYSRPAVPKTVNQVIYCHQKHCLLPVRTRATYLVALLVPRRPAWLNK